MKIIANSEEEGRYLFHSRLTLVGKESILPGSERWMDLCAGVPNDRMSAHNLQIFYECGETLYEDINKLIEMYGLHEEQYDIVEYRTTPCATYPNGILTKVMLRAMLNDEQLVIRRLGLRLEPMKEKTFLLE